MHLLPPVRARDTAVTSGAFIQGRSMLPRLVTTCRRLSAARGRSDRSCTAVNRSGSRLSAAGTYPSRLVGLQSLVADGRLTLCIEASPGSLWRTPRMTERTGLPVLSATFLALCRGGLSRIRIGIDPSRGMFGRGYRDRRMWTGSMALRPLCGHQGRLRMLVIAAVALSWCRRKGRYREELGSYKPRR
jgi:hypothetical protein